MSSSIQAQQQQRAAPQAHQAQAQQRVLQFDSNMDYPTASNPNSKAEAEARDPLPFPTARIGPCAKITTRIYHPKTGKVETVRDVLVEVVPLAVSSSGSSGHNSSSNNAASGGGANNPATVSASTTATTTINGRAVAVEFDDGAAGFSGAGEPMMAAGPRDDDSMSSGWSTSDSEMSDVAVGGGGANGPTQPNNRMDSAGGGVSGGSHGIPGITMAPSTAAAGAGTGNSGQPQPPQRAYWLQRTLREAIYGRVRYGVVLQRRTEPLPSPQSSAEIHDRTRTWNEPFVNRAGQPSCEWEVTEEACAVKEMSWQHIRKEQNRLAEDPIKEVAAMQYLKRYLAQCHGSPDALNSSDAMLSTHIMLPLDLLSDDRYLYSIMPFCDGGELFDRLDTKQKFSEPEARHWLCQILDGLENLQRAGICHRDMSLENLLVHQDRIALVIDFGMCLRIPYENSRPDGEDLFATPTAINSTGIGRPRQQSFSKEIRDSFMSMDLDSSGADPSADLGGAASNGEKASSSCGCQDIRQRKRYLIKPNGTCGKWHYMSPEIATNKVPFDGHAVDTWAVGVILFLMLAGFPPWERPCRTDERFKYMTAGYLVQMLQEWELGLSPDGMDLLQRMLWIDPRDRLSLLQVRAHPWMKQQ